MKNRRWMIRGVLGLTMWSTIGLGVAQAGVILPVNTSAPFSPMTNSAVSISIFQFGIDITDRWLPEPGQTVQIVVNGLASDVATSITFVPPVFANPIANSSLTTSAYPGVCTNFGLDTGGPAFPDFSLVGNNLTSNDCGGMAVILVNGLTFILPQDSNFNGIPDIWEAIFCPPANPCPTGKEDNEAGGSQPGDGIAAFDEYRGFMVSGVHIRTDPGQKDLFVHLRNPKCGTASLLGGGGVTYPTDGTSLFANVNTISGAQIHPLGYATPNANHAATDEWVDNLVDAVYNATTNTVTFTISNTTTDRQINKNAVYPVLDTITLNTIQKGLRITECLDTSVTTNPPMGSAGLGTPNGPDNAVLYTQRIVNSINGLITAGGTRPVRYFTYDGATPVLMFTSAGAPTDADRNFIISKAIQFYLSMELGHSVKLTPTVEGTRKTTYGYHHAPGTGSNLDQTIINTLDATFNSFYVPAFYNSNDDAAYRLHK